jgi:hypothetical protein
MGEYREKIEKNFWMMLCSSKIEIAGQEEYRRKFEPVFKIKADGAVKLIVTPLWSRLFSWTRSTSDPKELRKKFETVSKIDTGKVKEHIWKILLFSVSDKFNESTFREYFEPIINIDSKKAVKLFEDDLWTKLYALSKKTQDPKELSKQFEPIAQIDVKRAAEAIKEVDPEKYKFLQYYKI